VNPPKITPFSEFLAIVNVGPLSSHFKWKAGASKESSVPL
jgi:hypothetical protein